MKFDVIIGNPPYQGSGGSNHLWPKFIQKSISTIKDGGWLAYITPDKWREPVNPTAVGASIQIHNNNITVVKDTDSYFNIGESTSYFILSKEPYKGVTPVSYTHLTLPTILLV